MADETEKKTHVMHSRSRSFGQSPMLQTPPARKPLANSAKVGSSKHRFKAQAQTFVIDSKYVPTETLGSGSYGVVIGATDKTTKKRVAIKKVHNLFNDHLSAKRVLREVKLMNFCDHPNVMPLADLVEPDSFNSFADVYLVMDCMDTDLHAVIDSDNELSDDHLQYFLYQMLCGLQYMHSANVIHRDMKPTNILVNADCSLKICDLGLSRGISGKPTDDLTEYVVTRWYRAPEVMVASNNYDEKVDVWAIACIFAELLQRKPLMPGQDYMKQLNLMMDICGTPEGEDVGFITNEHALEYIMSRPKRRKVSMKELFPFYHNEQGLDLLSKMLVMNPAKRISVSDALKHPYLASMCEEFDMHTKVSPKKFDFGWEDLDLKDVNALRALMYEEVRRYRPNLPRLHASTVHPTVLKYLKDMKHEIDEEEFDPERHAFFQRSNSDLSASSRSSQGIPDLDKHTHAQ